MIWCKNVKLHQTIFTYKKVCCKLKWWTRCLIVQYFVFPISQCLQDKISFPCTYCSGVAGKKKKIAILLQKILLDFSTVIGIFNCLLVPNCSFCLHGTFRNIFKIKAYLTKRIRNNEKITVTLSRYYLKLVSNLRDPINFAP